MDDNKQEAKKNKLNKKSFKKLLGIYRFMLPYRGWFILGLISLVFSSTILLGFPYLTGKLVDTSLGKNDWVLKGIDDIALGLVAILISQSFFSFLRIYFFAQVSERSMADIRKGLYEKYMTLPVSFFDSHRTGELFSRITADISLLQDTFSVTLSEFIRQTSTLFIGIGILFVTNPKLTLFMLVTIPILAISGFVFGKFIKTLSKKTQDALAEANIIVEETLQAVSTVKTFTNERFETNRYNRSIKEVVDLALKNGIYRGAFVSFIIFALLGGIVLVLWFGASMVESGEISFGDLVTFILYTMFIGGSIGGLGNIYGSLQKAVGASDRVLDILEEDTELNVANIDNGVPKRFEGSIEFDNVTFAYPTRKDVTVLKGLNFKIEPGEKVALVGHSGAGKSTIAQLILRLYHNYNGHIGIDGVSMNDYTLNAYRKNIGIVPQDIVLFGGTIKENIAYGKINATDEEIRDAAKKAYALDFIESFPEGFDTVVGERGLKLSGGQRQRIAIARAILKDPAILILDEATSSLDAESEILVQQAIEELMKNRTTIVIAHRLATIRKVDKIFVIDKGLMVESGTHNELLALENGIYSNLVKLQFDLANG